MPNATIISASLDSKDLENSINKLVSTVKNKTNEMANHFTKKVSEMEASLKKLNSPDFGGSKSRQSSSMASGQKELEQQVKSTTQAIREEGATYDQLAQQMRNAVIQSQKRYDVSPIQNLRMQQHEIEAGMKTASAEAARAKKDVDEFNAAIESYRRTMASLPKDQQGFTNRQAIQKEINDLVVLRDVAAAEQNKWATAASQLADKHKEVNNQINAIGRALIDAEGKEAGLVNASRQNSEELEKQLRAIKEINSAKSAKTTFEQVASMPDDTVPKAMEKLEALRALKERVGNTPLLSASGVKKLEDSIYNTTVQIEHLKHVSQGGWMSKQQLEEQHQAIEKNRQETIKAEKDKKESISETTRAAQESAQKIRQSFYQQASDTKSRQPIGIIKDDMGRTVNQIEQLRKALSEMNSAYYSLSNENRESAIGLALKRDIDITQKALIAVQKYNEELAKGEKTRKLSGMAITDNASLTRLRQSLKHLTDQYNGLTIAELNAGKGDKLIQHFQDTARAAELLQKKLSRPISFEAINGFQPKTLDDMAYKMRQLQSYKQGIDLTKPNAAQDIRNVDDAMKTLQKDMDKYMSKAKGIESTNNALGRSWNYMKNRLAFYFTVGASTAFVKNLIEIRSQYEMNEKALGILIGSAEKGTQTFQELSQMALVSPYTLIELSNAARQLTAYDIAAKDVVDTTRRLADMASAVGVPMERLTYALGQIKAYGYLNSRDARMFANAGIPLVKQLSEYYTQLEGKMVSVGDVYTRMKQKAIDFNDVMAVVNKMTDSGGKFFDYQAKMADTLKVRLANLTLAWNNMLNDIGKSEQGILTAGINSLKTLFLHWKDINSILRNVAITFGFLKTAQFVVLLSAGKLATQMGWELLIGKKLTAMFVQLGAAMKAAFANPLFWASALALYLGQVFGDIYDATKAIKEFNNAIKSGAEDNYKNITQFLDQYTKLRNSLYANDFSQNKKDQKTQDIDPKEASKAWEAIREQIELTTNSSSDYIANLLTIDNMSERVRQGFMVLDDLQVVNAALKEMDDETINVTKDWSRWWNLWLLPDGLIDNIKDYNKELKIVREQAITDAEGLSNLSTAALHLDKDVKQVTDSIIDFINLKGWSKDEGKINEVFGQITQKLIQENQLNPDEAFILQEKFEEKRSEAAKQAIEGRIADEKAALKVARDENAREAILSEIKVNQERLNTFNLTNGRSRAEWERFTKWIKEQHISETTEMFRGMDAEDIRSLNFQEGKYNEYVTRMVTQYAKEHKMSYDEAFKYLKHWVANANQWSIFIPLIISTEDDKTIFQQLEEYDKAIDAADSQIDRLTKRIGELKNKKQLDKKETQELKSAEDELAAAQKAKADAESKGGHGKKEEKEAKKSATAAKKAQKEAESELQKALKDEIQLIDKVRAQFKKLTDAGYDSLSATAKVTNQFNASISNINKVLGKNGLPLFDIKSFSGTDDPNRILKMLEAQLKSAQVSKNIKPSEIKDLEVKYSEIVIDADVYNLTKVTKGLNNQLDRLKEDYELAVTLDAEPELGDLFANYWGINMETLPKTAEEYARRYTQYVNEALAKMPNNTLEIPNLLNLTKDDVEAFRQMVDDGNLSQKVFDVILKGYTDSHDAIQKEFKETAGEWDKLLEKYSEFQYKQTQIQKQANKERATLVKRFGDEDQKNLLASLMSQIEATTDNETKARLIEKLKALVTDVVGDDRTKMQLQVSIDTKEAREQAQLAFEEFQKTPDWITATGDLTNLTDKALMGLIDSINEYKRTATKLDPKQIRQMNKALSSLHKELRKGNPFHVIADAIDDARERASIYDDQIAQLESKIEEYYDRFSDLTEEERASLKNLIETLNKVKQKQEEMQKIEPTAVVEGINNAVEIAAKATEQFTKMAEALGGKHMTEASETINNIMGNIQAAGQGAAVGAQFGGYGAAIGATAAGLTDLVTRFADQWSGNRSITKKVIESEREVKKLEVAYVDLQHAIDKAYGSGIVGAKHAMAATKELELAELERQLRLEESRKSKNRDDDKILELRKQIKELRYEINNTVDEITNDLLGTEAGSFAEDMVKSMIDAFKKGEDYMQVFEDKFETMVDNMIMKSIVSKVVASYMDKLWSSMDDRIESKSIKARQQYEAATKERVRLENMSMSEFASEKYAMKAAWQYAEDGTRKQLTDMYNAELEVARNAERSAKEALDAASTIDKTDIAALMDELAEIKPELGQKLKEIFGEYYTFGSMVDKDLSALQQGIQSITEPTANALEAYANGISQQTYLQSDILVQIRDMMTTFNLDVQLATVSQILLQLQASYQVQMSIQGIMQGWSTPNGMGVRVEML